jgi:hypothetical protein
MRKTSRPGKITAALFLLAGIPAGFASAEQGFPGISVALSAERFEAEIGLIASAEHPIQQLVLPPVEIPWAGAFGLGASRDALRLANQTIPVRVPVWLPLRLTSPPAGMAGPEIEERVTSWLADLKSQVDFDFDGLLVEAGSGVSADVARLVVLSSSVALKTRLKERLIAVPATMMDALGPAAGAYVDRYTFRVGEDWAAEMGRFAEAKAPRPAFIVWEPGAGADAAEAYLENILSSDTESAEMFLLGAGGTDRLPALLAAGDLLRTQIAGQLSRLRGDHSILVLVRPDGSHPPQAVFVDGLLDSVAILARTGSTGAGGEPLQFVAEGGDRYGLTLYDPLESGRPPVQVSESTEVRWDRPYILLRAKKLAAASPRFAKTVEVSARVDLTVEEVIARWQRFNNRQKQLLMNYRSAVVMSLHFQPPGLGSGFDVALHYTYFWKNDGSQYWLQTAQYLNGMKIPGRQLFPLPMIEPDKVVIRPLELRLADEYVYALEGRETIRGIECYAVSFKPRPDAAERLYTGKVWIDASEFRGVRMLLVQSGGTGSILSHREVQTFDMIPGRGEYPFNILTRSDMEQKMLAAGREFLLERKYEFTGVEINAEDFEASLRDSLRGDSPMLAETASGLRELVKDASGERTVVEKVDRAVTAGIAGTLYDGSYAFPVPLLGVSAINGDFLKSGGQLSTFWAGPILALNYTKKTGSNLSLGADLFLNALARKDRVIRSGLEVESEAVSFYAESLGARLQWQPWTGFSLSATGYLTYEIFRRADETSGDFVLPRNGWTVNPNLELDVSRNGYQAQLSVSYSERLGWKDWGLPGNPDAPKKSFTLAHAKVGKQFYPTSFTRVGLELSYYTGSRLDRFSCYLPALMSTPKIRGIPSGAVSLREVGSADFNLGLTFFDIVRLDAYYSFARCTELSDPVRRFDFQGLEFDFGTVGPWRSYIQGVVSFAVKGLPDVYPQRWSAYLLIFIPFK